MKKYLLLIIIFCLTNGIAQTKYFNTFTLIDDGEGIDSFEHVRLELEKNSLSLYSDTFTVKNAYKTGVNELYNDSAKGAMVASEYKSTYYKIVLIRYMEFPNELYLKIIDLVDYQEYLIHLHNT